MKDEHPASLTLLQPPRPAALSAMAPLSDDLAARIQRLRLAPGGASLVAAFETFLRRLADKPETEGIVLLGSLGVEPDRHPLDDESDLDLAIFVSEGTCPAWTPEFSFQLHLGGDRLGPEVNVYQNRIGMIAPEACTVGNIPKYEAMSSARVVWDPRGTVTNALDRLLRSPDKSLLLTEALHRSDRFLRRSAAKLVRRNSVFAAHLLVTEAMNFLMQATFLLNGRFPPHTKWIEHDFNSLSWKPVDGQRRFRSALRIRAFSPRELQRRVDEGLRLLEELFRRAKEQGGVMENYYQLLCTRHHKDRQFLSAPLAQRAARDARARGMEMEPALLRGVVNTALCADYSELAVWLADLGEPCLAPLQALVAGEGPHPEGDKP